MFYLSNHPIYTIHFIRFRILLSHTIMTDIFTKKIQKNVRKMEIPPEILIRLSRQDGE